MDGKHQRLSMRLMEGAKMGGLGASGEEEEEEGGHRLHSVIIIGIGNCNTNVIPTSSSHYLSTYRAIELN